MRILEGKVAALESVPWKHSDSSMPLIKTSLRFDSGVSLTVLTQAEVKIKLDDAMVVAAYGLSQPYNVNSFKNLNTGKVWFKGATILLMTGITLAFCPWLFSLSNAVNTDLFVLKLFNYGFYAASLICFYRLLESYVAFQKIKKF